MVEPSSNYQVALISNITVKPLIMNQHPAFSYPLVHRLPLPLFLLPPSSCRYSKQTCNSISFAIFDIPPLSEDERRGRMSPEVRYNMTWIRRQPKCLFRPKSLFILKVKCKRTDRRTYGRTVERTDRPSYGDTRTLLKS